MIPANSFKELIVWQKAHQFALAVYRYTDSFPKGEMFGLTSQFRRASVSIPANISEGFGKKGKPDKLRYFNIAQGSLEECKYYLILSQDLGYGENLIIRGLSEEVSKLLTAYSKSIRIGICA